MVYSRNCGATQTLPQRRHHLQLRQANLPYNDTQMPPQTLLQHTQLHSASTRASPCRLTVSLRVQSVLPRR